MKSGRRQALNVILISSVSCWIIMSSLVIPGSHSLQYGIPNPSSPRHQLGYPNLDHRQRGIIGSSSHQQQQQYPMASPHGFRNPLAPLLTHHKVKKSKKLQNLNGGGGGGGGGSGLGSPYGYPASQMSQYGIPQMGHQQQESYGTRRGTGPTGYGFPG